MKGELQDFNDILLSWGQLGDKSVNSAIIDEDLAPNDALEFGEKVFSAGVANIPAVGHEIVQAAISFDDIVSGSALDKFDHLESDFE